MCKEVKSLEAFHKDRSRKDGFREKCRECTSFYVKDINKRRLEKRRQYDLSNKEHLYRYNKEYYDNNKEKIKKRRKILLLNKNKEFKKLLHESHVLLWKKLFLQEVKRKRRAETARQVYSKKSDLFCLKSASRRASKLNATPSWANIFFIQEIYSLARLRSKLTGIKWHVDHIVPLNNKIVQGLHVENNLRVVTYKENVIKSNRFWPDMPDLQLG